MAAERQANTRGALYVVATPIGNLGDIGRRALEVLADADLILAEDTRHSAKLLAHYGITTTCRSFHEHNEQRQVAGIVERIGAGERIALISDAGTPLISDPGFTLVAALRARGIAVVPIPGPSAAIGALSAAGLPTDRFCFEGFLPASAGGRRRRLESLRDEARTMIFYESPRRVGAMVVDLAAAFGGDRPAVLAREITKIHETFVDGTLDTLGQWLEAHAAQARGEFVVMVGGAPPKADTELESAARETLRVLLEELPVKRAAAVAARLTGAKRNVLYREALALAEARRETPGDDR
ncbi:MAG: 16S rRNA (cytidine(1402)-2'-O)-methyltransferase [Gammaproteobacteria bacterium]|nr:16S rRNA (cytidine(1402)-2'-O)-methyltransferase [Gammaproteobacteria bacterium]